MKPDSAVSAAQGTSASTGLDRVEPSPSGGSVSTPLAPSGPLTGGNGRRGSSAATAQGTVAGPAPRKPATAAADVAHTEGARLRAIERRFLVAIQAIVFGGGHPADRRCRHAVVVAPDSRRRDERAHCTAAAPVRVPDDMDGFMVMGSAVVMRHAITDKVGGRTWYAGALVAATATLSICLNIQDSTGREVVPAWALPGSRQRCTCSVQNSV